MDRTAASGSGGAVAPHARVASPVPCPVVPDEALAGAVAAHSPGNNSPRLAIKGLAKKTFGKKKDGSVCATAAGSVPPPVTPKEETTNNNNSNQRRTTSSMSSIPNRTSSSTSVSSSASSTAPRSKHSKTETSKSSKSGSLSSSKSASTSKLSKSAVAALQAANSGLPAPSSGTGIPKPGSRGAKLPSKEDANKNRLSASSKTSSLSSTSIHDSLTNNSKLAASAPSVTKASLLQGRSTPSSQSHQVNNQVSAQEMRGSMSKSSRSGNASMLQGAVSPGDKLANGSARTSSGMSGSSMAMGKGVRYTGTPRATTPGQQQGGSGSREMSHSTSGHALSKSQLQLPKTNQASKPKKVDSDTQTQMSAINPGLVKPVKIVQGKTHIQPPQQVAPGGRGSSPNHQQLQQQQLQLQQQQLQQHQAASMAKLHDKAAKSGKARSPRNSAPSSKEHSNTSLNSDSNSASNSTSNSNNSASSTDSVIFRPSSCDELESGMDSDTNSAPRSPRLPPQPRAAQNFPQAHPSSPHQRVAPNSPHQRAPGSPHQGAAPGSPHLAPGQNSPQKPSLPYTDHITQLRQSRGSQSPSTKSSRKMETTFDTEVRTEEKEVVQTPPRETTIGDDTENFDEDITPMQPIMRSMPYSYLRGPSPLPRPSFHIPSLSCQNQHLAHSAQSRLGVNRPLIDPAKLYTHSMKRTISNCTSVLESDYSSDAEGFDIAAGYMSDGDILRSHQPDDCSGYMSEGGASLYARRMQQRFREGMLAVKECMQKSSGLVDDDRLVSCVISPYLILFILAK